MKNVVVVKNIWDEDLNSELIQEERENQPSEVFKRGQHEANHEPGMLKDAAL